MAPTIQAVTERIKALLNDTVVLKFSVFPSVIQSTIHWMFQPLGNDTSSTEDSPHLSSDHLSLTIFNVALNDRGLYKVTVTNKAGRSEATITLDVYGNIAIIHDMTKFLINIAVKAKIISTGATLFRKKGQTISFKCTAFGVPSPTIVWRRNGQLLINSLRFTIKESHSSYIFEIKQTTSTLTIAKLVKSDDGNYSCRADNEAKVGDILAEPFTLIITECKFTVSLAYSKYSILAFSVNYCASSPCQNKGKCSNLNNGYNCECPETFTGINCNESMYYSIV